MWSYSYFWCFGNSTKWNPVRDVFWFIFITFDDLKINSVGGQNQSRHFVIWHLNFRFIWTGIFKNIILILHLITKWGRSRLYYKASFLFLKTIELFWSHNTYPLKNILKENKYSSNSDLKYITSYISQVHTVGPRDMQVTWYKSILCPISKIMILSWKNKRVK